MVSPRFLTDDTNGDIGVFDVSDRRQRIVDRHSIVNDRRQRIVDRHSIVSDRRQKIVDRHSI